MNQQPKKTFITTNKLINGLNKLSLLHDKNTIDILFDDLMEANYYGRKIRNIRILSIEDIDLNNLFEIAEGTNVWLNVSTQLNNIDFSMVKHLNKLSIEVKENTYENSNGNIIYHKIKCIKLPKNEANKKLMDKLNNELSKKHVERFNSSAQKIRDDSCFFDD